jgi:myo-inositol 2-dehydrogenase / D-chiro-inositol 1-dehydrogenase
VGIRTRGRRSVRDRRQPWRGFLRGGRRRGLGSCTLTLDDGTLAVCTATRYNGAGYDVRFEAHGSTGALTAGIDARAPLPPAATGQPYADFGERFRDAYVAELAAFCDLVANTGENTCPGAEALAAMLVAEAAELSRRDNRRVRIEEVSR